MNQTTKTPAAHPRTLASARADRDYMQVRLIAQGDKVFAGRAGKVRMSHDGLAENEALLDELQRQFYALDEECDELREWNMHPYCDDCGCRITLGRCAHGVMSTQPLVELAAWQTEMHADTLCIGKTPDSRAVWQNGSSAPFIIVHDAKQKRHVIEVRAEEFTRLDEPYAYGSIRNTELPETAVTLIPKGQTP